MKLENYSRRVKVGVRRDRLLIKTLDYIRDIRRNSMGSYEGRKAVIKKMERNQRLIKRYGDDIFKFYTSKDHIEVLPKIDLN